MFSNFLIESSYGISHIEDLPPFELIKALDSLNRYTFTQKVDGANLAFGIDVNGKFYTSREHKGGTRFYTSTEYPNESKYDAFRTAHLALQKVISKIRAIIEPGSKISIEVILNNQPNAVSYNENQIVFLEPLEGDDPTLELDFSVIDKLSSKLRNDSVEVQTKLSNSDNGTSILELPTTTKWIFKRSNKINNADIITDDAKKAIENIKAFLKNKVENKKVIDILLSKDRDSKPLRDKLKDELRNLVIDLKKLLLTDSLKSKLKPKDVRDGYYDGIEGIVATDIKTGKKIKIVDRDEFTKVSKFYYQYRNMIDSNVLTADNTADIETRGGIIGIAKTRCISLFNIPGLELPTSRKHSLSMFGDKSNFKINLSKVLTELSFPSLKQKMIAIYDNANNELSELLDEFTKGVDSKITLKINNTELKYTPEIKQKTLLAFANAKQEISKIKRKISHTKSINDLFLVFFKDDINALF